MTHEIRDSHSDVIRWICPTCGSQQTTTIDPATVEAEFTVVCGDCGSGEEVTHP